jgi:DNA-binding SARP family transcriptional activator
MARSGHLMGIDMTDVQNNAGCWTVHLLGRFDVVGPHAAVDVPPAAARLVAYLAIQGQPIRRTIIAATIWPDVEEGRARANLRSTVFRLAGLAPILDATATTLGIASGVTVDVHDLQALVLAARLGERPGGTPRAGFDLELLPGWSEEWIELERERVRQLELHLLDDIIAHSVEEGRYGDAVDAAIRAIRLDPLRECSHAGLLRALLAEGDRAAVIAHYRKFAAVMERELGLPPSPDLTTLVETILPARPAGPRLTARSGRP